MMWTALLMAATLAAAPAAQAQDPDRVWVWNVRCTTPTTIALEVRLDGMTIYAISLPMCRWDREHEEGRASFRFTPARPLVWEDPGHTTPAGTTLEVDFWQAGGEADEIELGYTVDAADGLHMNSIHMLSPTEKRTTEMAPGLILETFPSKKRK